MLIPGVEGLNMFTLFNFIIKVTWERYCSQGGTLYLAPQAGIWAGKGRCCSIGMSRDNVSMNVRL